jgi:hypothetical protein
MSSQAIYSGFSYVGRQNETPSDTSTTVSLEYLVYNWGGKFRSILETFTLDRCALSQQNCGICGDWETSLILASSSCHLEILLQSLEMMSTK